MEYSFIHAFLHADHFSYDDCLYVPLLSALNFTVYELPLISLPKIKSCYSEYQCMLSLIQPTLEVTQSLIAFDLFIHTQ